jgi:membrane-bound lytic murein transglycosylase A
MKVSQHWRIASSSQISISVITDASVTKVAQSCTSLTNLNLYGCEKLIKKNDWKMPCEEAKNLLSPSNKEVIEYLHTYFDLYKAKNEDGSSKGLITGYYQPLLMGSRTKTKKYKIPLYSPPLDLITVELSEIYPELKYKRLRGRVEGNKLIPYFTRE